MQSASTRQPPCPAISGTVYGVVLNDRASLNSIGAALEDAPYKGAPKAPVMYIKPRNTLTGSGAVVQLPAGADAVEIGATVGILIGRPAARLHAADAMSVIAGFALVADLSLPHASYYRPAIREKCFDASCPVGNVAAADLAGDLRELVLQTTIDDRLVAQWPLAHLVRDVPQLLADITEFMSLDTGDMVLVGVPYLAPQAVAGSRVQVGANRPELGTLTFSIAAEGGKA
ncbi:fumarylacetoacetate hydrolase family protein [Noviherbaspirillum cavernae]|nr:fumarylacetoacetate hydrolase family protein [Noviherbaspirillum cavernae]